MNEFEFIRKAAEGWPKTAEGLLCGIGDDAAVIEGPRGSKWLVTTDLFAEGVHFRRGWCGWAVHGEKALLSNISDIAAMGGMPWFYFVSVASPKDVSAPELLDFMEGMAKAAKKYDMILAGGDTSASEAGLVASLTVMGMADDDRIMCRSGASPGDGIFVSGRLGGARAGLACLEKGHPGHVHLVERFLRPAPRVRLGNWLAGNACASAMIDISDGLIADLNHIADLSGVGYAIDAAKVPADDGVFEVAEAVQMDAMDMMLAGGEDYELLFTMSPLQEEKFINDASRVDFGCGITKIGAVVGDKNARRVCGAGGRAIEAGRSGFVHDIGG
jgi:thiamine-monophosphate kinase